MKTQKFFGITLLVVLLISCKETNNQLHKKINLFTDDLNREIYLESIPQKIISLAPNLTEMIYDLGLQNHLVGNTQYCDYPDSAKQIEKVGDLVSVNFEKIIALKPDLIFITVEGNTKETYNKFNELGLKVFVSNPRNYKGIKKTYTDIANIFHIKNTAAKRIDVWDKTVFDVRNVSKNYDSSSAVIFVELKPIMLAGSSSFLNEFIQLCGLKNIASDSRMNYPVFSREEILKRDPDYIVYPSDGDDDVNIFIENYPEWKNLKAIKNRHVVFVDRNLYFRPGPRFVKALENLFKDLHR